MSVDTLYKGDTEDNNNNIIYTIGKEVLYFTEEHFVAVYRGVVHLLCCSFVRNLKSSYQLMYYSLSEVT